MTLAVFGKELSVDVKVAGIDFTVKFEPATTSAGAMARKFCLEQGGHFGITESTLDNCINPITAHFQKAVDSRDAADSQAAVSQKAASTTQLTPVLAKFKVGDLDYQINFYPTLATPEQVAIEFCDKKGGEFGITRETFAACTTPVTAHIAGVLQEYQRAQLAAVAAGTPAPVEHKTVNIDLKIAEQEFKLRFQPAVTSTASVATQLCTEKGASFGVTNDTLPGCINTITNYLDQEVARQQ